jgi:hypothetical protein
MTLASGHQFEGHWWEHALAPSKHECKHGQCATPMSILLITTNMFFFSPNLPEELESRHQTFPIPNQRVGFQQTTQVKHEWRCCMTRKIVKQRDLKHEHGGCLIEAIVSYTHYLYNINYYYIIIKLL